MHNATCHKEPPMAFVKRSKFNMSVAMTPCPWLKLFSKEQPRESSEEVDSARPASSRSGQQGLANVREQIPMENADKDIKHDTD